MATDPAKAESQRRVLVTGGAGFIGSHLVAALLARGDDVTVLDDLSTGRRSNLDAVDPSGRVRFIEGDARRTLPGLEGEAPFDELYHLAAAVGVALVLDDPIGSIDTNVELTSLVLRFASGRDGDAPRAHRVLIASSSEVYGKSPHAVFSESDDVTYGPTSMTRWSYAYAKAIDEFLGLAYTRETPIDVVCARLFNTVGPRQIGSYGMVLPRFVAAALRGEPLTVYGDGAQSRCFCDVRDVCRALIGLVELLPDGAGVYNVGADEPITIGGLAERVREVVGSASVIERVSYEKVYPAGFEDLAQRRPDLSKLRSAIGFEPRIDLRQTIEDVAAWIRDGEEAAAARGGAAR